MNKIILLILFSTFVYSQDIKYSLNAGTNYSSVISESGIQYQNGITLGFSRERILNTNQSSFEILYLYTLKKSSLENKTIKYVDNGVSITQGDIHIKLATIDICMHKNFYWSVHEPFRFSLLAGPCFSLCISDKSTTWTDKSLCSSNINDINCQDLNYDYDTENDNLSGFITKLSNSGFGFDFGIGFHFNNLAVKFIYQLPLYQIDTVKNIKLDKYYHAVNIFLACSF